MTRDEMIRLVMKSPAMPANLKGLAVTMLYIASAAEVQKVSNIFNEAESVYARDGAEGLKKFLIASGVPPEGADIITRIAPHASEHRSNNPI